MGKNNPQNKTPDETKTTTEDQKVTKPLSPPDGTQASSEKPAEPPLTDGMTGAEKAGVAPEASPDPPDDHAGDEPTAPSLTAQETGAPGRHLEIIVRKFGGVPREIVHKYTDSILILLDGTKLTKDQHDALIKRANEEE